MLGIDAATAGALETKGIATAAPAAPSINSRREKRWWRDDFMDSPCGFLLVSYVQLSVIQRRCRYQPSFQAEALRLSSRRVLFICFCRSRLAGLQGSCLVVSGERLPRFQPADLGGKGHALQRSDSQED